MNFLVNSDYFRKRINEAIEKKCDCFFVMQKTLRMFNSTEVIELMVESTRDSYYSGSDSGLFNPEDWQRISTYLQYLPEQPIKVKIEEGGIEITQHVACFKI